MNGSKEEHFPSKIRTDTLVRKIRTKRRVGDPWIRHLPLSPRGQSRALVVTVFPCNPQSSLEESLTTCPIAPAGCALGLGTGRFANLSSRSCYLFVCSSFLVSTSFPAEWAQCSASLDRDFVCVLLFQQVHDLWVTKGAVAICAPLWLVWDVS